MSRCHPVPSYLLLLVTVILTTSGRGSSLCRQDQSAALLRLKASFRFDTTFPNCQWFPFDSTFPLSSWKVDTDCCTWKSVTCDGTSGYVTALDLSELCISGNLSSSDDIFKLTSLHSLSLAYNSFDGSPWPSPGLEQLTDLKNLDLSYSGLSGNLPVKKGQLSNLVTLELSGLDIKYLSLQTLIGNLGGLQELALYGANISISPANVARASYTNTTSGLEALYMGQCRITGGRFDTVLTNIIFHSKLANLVILDLFDLDLKYLSLDILIDNLVNLQDLNLVHVNISVSSTDLAHASSTNNMMSNLTDLSMTGCTITGTRPDTLLTTLFHSKLTNLVTLDLTGFDLKNLSLDALINNLGSLQKLYLDSISILVSPTDLAHTSSTNMTPGLKELSMTQCKITGRIDIALTKFRSLSVLTLDGTHFSGPAPAPVPAHFVEFSSLTALSLQSCGLTRATFPSWIFRIKSLMSLDVSGNENLCGELPEFIEGSALQELKVSGTKFSGKIPKSIRNLRNLTWLDLSNCQFDGIIPSFAQWSMIEWVDLSGNNLTGSLPSDGYLSVHSLTFLSLSNNSMSGVIPASLFSHPSLVDLDLSKNNFTGKFLLYPTMLSSSLRSIDVSYNKLQGPLPKLLSKFPELYRLDLSSNNLNGTVHLSFIKDYKEFDYLSLSNNKLSVVEEDANHSHAKYPVIRDYLGLASCNLSYVPKFLMQQSIDNLDLSNNNIGGHIPDWIWGIGGSRLNLSHNLFVSVNLNLLNTSIHDVDLHSNKIEGALPLPPSGTYRLDYSNNQFNSSITPEFWSRASSANSLSLANNSLTGEISHLICNATDIEVLDLSLNGFSGLIPPCLLKHAKHLVILNLRGNKFHGSLPQDISEDCALQIIDLNGNKFMGKLPVSLINCQMLQFLDLGNNLLLDTYPEWLGVLPLLKVLVMKSNGFYGPIDYSGMNKTHPFFPELQVLDLSSNSFNGSIPTQFLKQFKAMMLVSSSGVSGMDVGVNETSAGNSTIQTQSHYRESVTVTLKGHETLVQVLSVFMTLDLSNNYFEGIIPNEIVNLKFLKGLNLSSNSFTGMIPPLIANMLQLESLDLSHNQLSGEIPPAMAAMSFLEVLDLSYNQLSGKIPQSGQFLTFPNTSFVGNDWLCGKPLSRLCDEPNQAPSAAPTPGPTKDMNWEFLSVELGIISGLAVVVVTTLLWGNGRRWLSWHVDKFWLLVLLPWICRHLP
ncbi:unnamed protein product [Urochloa humidicola]